ncbi:exonuclease SbcC [Salsuginibacillus halophilus]|uniref:Nuclease SbcCD subunit C n=1 Tax=Salsuginibacillus halophilus TaxID=517424 RepID=A0A2P8HYH2_9BACI|nr:AAA family ATPase [Salsuginibacillus halophilus]PSL51259.1 exonuclease SbcC [Salsuginibacillus halophilus]
MKQIKKLRLENFQSHEDTTVEMTNGLNVIAGESDSGKTAVIRALRWLLFNQPRGTDFIRSGANVCRVTADFADGTKIIRERTTSKNSYHITNPDGSTEPYESFGARVPAAVIEAHGMQPLAVDNDETLHLQIAQQLEPPFLIENTAGSKAKVIGRISGAHYIDMALRGLNSDTASLKQSIKKEKENEDRLENALAPYENLDEHKRTLEKARQRFEALQQKEDVLRQLKQHQLKLKELKGIRTSVQKELHDLQFIEEAAPKLENLQLQKQTLLALKQRQSRYQHVQTEQKTWQKTKEKAETALSLEEKAAAIERNVTQRRHFFELKQTYSNMILKFNEEQERLRNAQQIEAQAARVEQAEQTLTKKMKFESLRTKLTSVTKERNDVHQHYTKLKQTANAEKQLEEAESRLISRRKLQQKHEALEEVKSRKKRGRSYIHELQAEVDRQQEAYESLLKQLGTCPLCGQALTPKHEHETKGVE